MKQEEISDIIGSLGVGDVLQIRLRTNKQLVCEIRLFINTDGQPLYERRHCIRRMRYYEDKRLLTEWLKIVPPTVAETRLIKKSLE